MFAIIRTLRPVIPHTQQIARLSISCRGKPIPRSDLYAYSNGRFLINEEEQFSRRYRQFDVDALCDVAAAAAAATAATATGTGKSSGSGCDGGGGIERITSIDKLEGGFSKALLMKTSSGGEVIAKIPYRIAGPGPLVTVAEVGVLEYMRKYTTIPVPKVFASCAVTDASNPVGAEYILMEKAPGVLLFERWGEMKEIEKLELIKGLTKLEAQLSGFAFPAYGGLYRRDDVDCGKRVDLDADVDEAQMFCIGPLSGHCPVGDVNPRVSSRNEESNNGPWTKLSDFGLSLLRQELSRIATQPNTQNQSPIHRGTPGERTRLLEATTALLELLDKHPLLSQHSQPTLWHTDLHMGNIFVAPDNNSQITALIDLQSLSVRPFFLQARWPVFLHPPRNYPRGFIHPTPPENLDDLDEDDQTLAVHEWRQAKMAKAYEVSTFLENRHAYNAMHIPTLFRDLFLRAGEVSDVGIVPLRECLIQIAQNWSSLDMSGQCPYSFSEEEISVHEAQFVKYRAWNEVQLLAMEALDTDAEGWVAPGVDFEKKKDQNRELLGLFVKRMAGEIGEEEERRMWPFPG